MGRMAADWTAPEPDPIPEDHTASMASVADIAKWRSARPAACAPKSRESFFAPEQAEVEEIYDARDDEVSEHTLRRPYRVEGAGGGSSSKVGKKEAPRKTPQERIDIAIAMMRQQNPMNFLPETDEQQNYRLAIAAMKKAERDFHKIGRPRLGSETREHVSMRVDASTRLFIREMGLNIGEIVDRFVENVKKDPDAMRVLTQPAISDRLAA